MLVRATATAAGRVVDRLTALVLVLGALALAGPVLAQPAVERDIEAEHAPERTLRDAAVAQLGAAEWIDRLSGVYALQRMGAAAAPAAPALVAALGDENGLVRVEAAEALTRIGDPAVPLLVPQLTSRREEVRYLAAQTLGRIGLGAAVALPELRAAASTDDAPDVREAATLAVAVIAPAGVSGWLYKLAYEIGDEPSGIPFLLAGFVLLTTLAAMRPLARAWRRARAVQPAQGAPDGARGAGDGARGAGDGAGDAADDADDADDEGDDDEADDEGDDEAQHGDAAQQPAARAGSAVPASAAEPRLPPPQGVPHAIAGLAAITVGALVALLATYRGDVDLDERHGMYHFAALFLLFGYLFAKIGLKGAWLERRARARARRATERWLRDRDWSRDGSGPIKAERVLPNLLALLLWVAFLAPFHTVWRLPFSWWGVWIALAVFDLIALVMVVATARRAWRRLRAGRCVLRWQGVPVRPGGTFSARFESARSLEGDQKLTATLRCLRDRSDNRVTGDEAAADAEEVYADARSFQIHGRPEGGSWAQLSFAVPGDARGTSSFGSRPVRWVVTVALPTAGPDFRTTFPVPIYR